MKKFINATIYGNPDAHEILIENDRFKTIGNDLDSADEVIDFL